MPLLAASPMLLRRAVAPEASWRQRPVAQARSPPMAPRYTIYSMSCHITPPPLVLNRESDVSADLPPGRPRCSSRVPWEPLTCVLPSAGHLGRSYFTGQAPYSHKGTIHRSGKFARARSPGSFGSKPHFCGCLRRADSTEFSRPRQSRRPAHVTGEQSYLNAVDSAHATKGATVLVDPAGKLEVPRF